MIGLNKDLRSLKNFDYKKERGEGQWKRDWVDVYYQHFPALDGRKWNIFGFHEMMQALAWAWEESETCHKYRTARDIFGKIPCSRPLARGELFS